MREKWGGGGGVVREIKREGARERERGEGRESKNKVQTGIIFLSRRTL